MGPLAVTDEELVSVEGAADTRMLNEVIHNPRAAMAMGSAGSVLEQVYKKAKVGALYIELCYNHIGSQMI